MNAFYSFAVFERAFTKPFRYGKEQVSSRRGLLLRRHEANGASICSEASPLPGHSSERLEEVLQAIEHLSSAQMEEMLNRPETAKHLPPSLRFAIAGLSAQAEKTPFRAVNSNALLDWRLGSESVSQFENLQKKGYRVFKLKVLEESAAELTDFLRSLKAGNWKIRLDGNRSLSAEKVAGLFQSLVKSNLVGAIDYFEEPLEAGWQHPLLRESPVPLAADESASSREAVLSLLENQNAPQVFILKPTVLGGLDIATSLTGQLASAGRRAVFTSTLETEPGRRSLLAYLGHESGGETHGLSTGYLFRENFLPDLPVYKEIPSPSTEEISYLQSLDWRGCP
ncbi:MAG: enolase C-terminal domain-like protein [Bdellovibrionota bacterium]